MSIIEEKRLREFIRFLMEETEVLGEPDFIDGRDEEEEGHHDEASVGGVPGPMLPLGMGTKKQRRNRRKDAEEANASGFGGATSYKERK